MKLQFIGSTSRLNQPLMGSHNLFRFTFEPSNCFIPWIFECVSDVFDKHKGWWCTYNRSRHINSRNSGQVPSNFIETFFTFYYPFTIINKVIGITELEIVKHESLIDLWSTAQLTVIKTLICIKSRFWEPWQRWKEEIHRNSSITVRHWHSTTSWFMLRFVIMRNYG